MTSDRASAYRRVLQTLEDMGPAKLHPHEQEAIRQAADALLFAGSAEDGAALDAMGSIEQLCRGLADSGRWERARAARLADEVAACGAPPGWHARAA